MSLLDQLAEEHRLIDALAGSLICLGRGLAAGGAGASDVAEFVHVMRVFVEGFHHQREEQELFATLVRRAEVPGNRGPIAVLGDEHRELAHLVDRLEGCAHEPAMAARAGRSLATMLWEHVDKERSVLLPEARQRLIRGGLPQLAGREMTGEEEAARERGEELLTRFPPMEDPEVMRGDGCIACSAFAVICGGIEKEWWNDWETEHYRSLDEG